MRCGRIEAPVADRSHIAFCHVERDDSEAKFRLDPVRLERSRGVRALELNRLRELVESHRELLLGSWNEFFHG
jgi:hypothetical protein